MEANSNAFAFKQDKAFVVVECKLTQKSAYYVDTVYSYSFGW